MPSFLSREDFSPLFPRHPTRVYSRLHHTHATRSQQLIPFVVALKNKNLTMAGFEVTESTYNNSNTRGCHYLLIEHRGCNNYSILKYTAFKCSQLKALLLNSRNRVIATFVVPLRLPRPRKVHINSALYVSIYYTWPTGVVWYYHYIYYEWD